MTPSEPSDFLTSVNSFDLTLKEVIADVQAAEASNPLSSPRNPRGDEMRIRISNTCNGDSRGAHWFTVAYSISPRAAAPPGPQPQQPLDAHDGRCVSCGDTDAEVVETCPGCDGPAHRECLTWSQHQNGGRGGNVCAGCNPSSGYYNRWYEAPRPQTTSHLRQASAAAARQSVCSYCLRGDPIGSESLQLCAECGDEGVHFSCMALDYPSLSGQSRALCDSCANDM